MCDPVFKKSDSCYHIRFGWGTVDTVDENGNIFVIFKDKKAAGFFRFLSDGRFESSDKFPLLFKTVPKIEGIGRPCTRIEITGWVNVYPTRFTTNKDQITYEVRGHVNETEEEADKAALSHRFGKALKITHSALQYD